MPPPITFTAIIHSEGPEERDEVGRRVAVDDVAELRPRRRDVGGRVVEGGPLQDRVHEHVLALGLRRLRRAALGLAGVDLLEALLADRGRDVGGVGAEPRRGRARCQVAVARGAEDAVGELPVEVVRAACQPLGERGEKSSVSQPSLMPSAASSLRRRRASRTLTPRPTPARAAAPRNGAKPIDSGTAGPRPCRSTVWVVSSER